MRRNLKNFYTDEDGAITVDWVTLTAAVVILGLAIIGIIQTGALNGITNMWASTEGIL